jgi:hypothetical protein
MIRTLAGALGAFGHAARLFRIARVHRGRSRRSPRHQQILQVVAVFSTEAAPLGMEIADELAFADRSASYGLLHPKAMVLNRLGKSADEVV